MLKGTPRPTAADKRQIVQIAAIKYDLAKQEELGNLDILTRPAYEKTVSAFFEELTGITQQQIDDSAIPFPQALQQLAAFCGETPIMTFDQDWFVIEQNCSYFELKNPFVAEFTRVKSLLPGWGIDPDAYSSGTLYKAAGLDMDGHVHNALHDVRSMAAAVAHLSKQ
ncbi:hypothetical protein BH09PAT4_BH09PAT4_03910 [soil metagenome]